MPNSGQLKLAGLGKSLILRSFPSKAIRARHERVAAGLQTGPEQDIACLGLLLVEMCTQNRLDEACEMPMSVARRVINGKLAGEVRDWLELCLLQRPSASRLLAHPFVTDYSSPACSQPIPLSTAQHIVDIEVKVPSKRLKSLQSVSFPYDLDKDTPERVAEEMVVELQLSSELASMITQQISAQIYGNLAECPTLSSSRESLVEELGQSCKSVQGKHSRRTKSDYFFPSSQEKDSPKTMKDHSKRDMQQLQQARVRKYAAEDSGRV